MQRYDIQSVTITSVSLPNTIGLSFFCHQSIGRTRRCSEIYDISFSGNIYGVWISIDRNGQVIENRLTVDSLLEFEVSMVLLYQILIGFG